MSTERILILYIAHYFPPLGGVASLRSLKMVKYLSDQGIDCVVLSANPKGIREPKDESLCREIPKQTVIHRYWAPDVSWLYKVLWGLHLPKLVDWIAQNLLSPDGMILALPFTWQKLKNIMRKGPRPSLAVISGGPFSMLRLGPQLKAVYKIPYICDWRDEWTNNAQRINRGYPPKILARERRLESQILSCAIGSVFLTDLMRGNFVKSHPFVISQPYRIIPNGYDEADFDSFQSLKHNSGKLRVIYTGSFYDRIQPDNLWQAIAELVKANLLEHNQLEIIIIGKNNPEFVLGSYANAQIIKSIVWFEGFKTHQDCLVQMQYADMLLIYIPSGENSASILTGKLFDYLRSGKAILTIAPPEGLAAKIVTEAGCGFVADFDDINSIKDQLLKICSQWKLGSLSGIMTDQTYISQFSRKHQAKVLSELIRESLHA